MIPFSYRVKLLILAFSMFFLSACTSSDEMADLHVYVEDILAQEGGYIDPLPEIKPVERYLYQSSELRDPFDATFGGEDEDDSPILDNERQRALQREVSQRNKEELEQFELDGLRMVGTMEQEVFLWGVVKDPEGIVYRVKIGNYMGKNYGKIIDISEDQIELREIIRDAHGAWEEREAIVALSEGDELENG